MNKFSHISASQITMFKDSCQRKWYEIYVNGEQLPSSKAQERGQLVHSYLEDYIIKGILPDTETDEGKIAISGIHYLPTFEEGKVFVEQSLDQYPPLSPTVKFKGFIDCLIVQEDCIEILDHKTTSAKKYMLTELELMTNTQLIIYARHVMQKYPHKKFKLSHVYYLTTAPHKAEKRSVEVDREHVMTIFNGMTPTIKSMIDAYDQSIDDMHKNESNCFAYGQRCPFYLRCKRAEMSDMFKPLEAPPPVDTAKDILSYLLNQKPTEPILEKEEKTMPTPTTQEREPLILFVSCAIVKGQIATLALDALKPMINEICTRERVPHISTIQYGRGYDMLNTMLIQQGKLPCSMQIDARSFEYQKIGATLEALADIVVRGV